MTEGPSTKPVDIRLLQQCIDGELSEPAEVDFLRSLDQQPEHWRGLALGFIEDRLLRRACQSLPLEEPVQKAPQAALAQRQPSRREQGSWLPFAATLSLSLCLGVAMGLTWVTWHRSAGSGLVNESNLAATEQVAESQVAPKPTNAVNVPIDGTAAQFASERQSTPLGRPTNSLAGQPLSVDPVYELGFQDGNDESVVVPVYPYTSAHPDMYTRKSVIPQNVEAALRQRGYSVNQQRRYMVIDLEDGRRIVVPQEAVSVEYDVQ
ncbi:MAG: hypothetical protein KDA88_03090 [Planctomycetaceae bacterium]|nr:hypothetical protein [Planctomycetaceae bacterium]